MPPSDYRFDAHSVPVTDENNQPAAQKADQALDLLRHEARLHQQQHDQTGLIGRALTGVTEFWHHSGSTGAQVDSLADKIQADLATGKTGEAASLAGQAKAVVTADQKALQTGGEIAQIGSGVLQAAGLFMAGKKGFVVAWTVAALDAIKPGSKDSLTEQLTDVGLGVSRAMVLKGGFVAASKFNLGMATTAVGLGVTSRVTDLALNRKTYLDSDSGKYDAALGAQRLWAGTTDKGALATDIASFVIARGALGKLNLATDGALTSNKLLTNVAVGGVFGASQGGVAEIMRQEKTGSFDAGQFAKRTLVGGLTAMAGAALGGVGGERTALAERPLASRGLSDGQAGETGLASLELSSVRNARANFIGSNSRQYQLVGGLQNVAETLAKSGSTAVLASVREVGAGGALGPEQKMLVQHSGEGSPLDTTLAAKADLVATCNPRLLPASGLAKHIMPSVQESLWLTQKPGGLLNFSANRPLSLLPGETQPVALGNRPVSEILQDPSTLEKIYAQPNPHDLGLYSQVLRNFKIPAKQVLVGGADSLVLELADDSILKITHQQWNPEWGHRTYFDSQGVERVFDAQIIGKPQTIERRDGSATYYIQERAKPITSESSVFTFADRLARGGRYNFWDRDPTQLGLVLRNGKPVVKLLDYDAVRPPHLVPRDLKVPHEDRFDFEDRFGRY